MTHKICDQCETVAHCSAFGCIPITQIAAAEGHHSDKGYELGTPEAYAAFVAKRNQSTPYDPSTDVCELAKWLNEEPNRELNRPALARVLAYLQ